MWELDHKEVWVPKSWCFQIVLLEKPLGSPLDSKDINQSILKKINPEYSLEGLLLKLEFHYFGHLMWRAHSLEKILVLGKIESRRRRGWQRMRWLDSITDSMDLNLSKFQELVKNRKAWHAVIHGVAESDTTEGQTPKTQQLHEPLNLYPGIWNVSFIRCLILRASQSVAFAIVWCYMRRLYGSNTNARIINPRHFCSSMTLFQAARLPFILVKFSLLISSQGNPSTTLQHPGQFGSFLTQRWACFCIYIVWLTCSVTQWASYFLSNSQQ